MEGPALVIELSTISASTVEGSILESRTIRDMCLYCGWLLCLHRTVRDSGFSVDGSALDAEPSMMRGVFVDGSGLENGTFHDFGLQRGGFRSGR